MKNIRIKKVVIYASLLAVFSFGFVSNVVAPFDNYFEISKNLDIFGKLFREINSTYVDDVDPSKFMRSGIDAMLKDLDPYTQFISASEIEDYRFMSTGQYGGVGALVNKRDGKVMITEPYKGYPAEKSGLRAGDVILKIDSEDLTKADINSLDIRNLLRGQPNTIVKLRVQRLGVPEPFEVDVNREEIKITNVPHFSMIDKETGYISLTGFTKDAANEVKTALERLKKENPSMKGLVLDLRDNPGGLLFEAVDISNLFVSQGENIVETRGRIEGSVNQYRARNLPIDTIIPLAVLINRKSASASEIVSGVVQDLDRGIVVGTRSFGKGLVQTTRPLSYNTQLKITTAKYYTPSGRCIQAIDYANRNEDGSVGKIPDSLKNQFKTKAGRIVFDGGGVEPDLPIELEEFHTITKELEAQNIIFDYATKFRQEHESISSAREFKISEEIFNDFVKFAREKKFNFESKTEKKLKELIDLLQQEHYYDELKNEVSSMEARVHDEKNQDYFAFKNEISDLLKSHIVSRYYYRDGQIEASFAYDKQIIEATKALKDQTKYKSLLETKK